MTWQWVESYGPFGDGRRAFFLRPSYDSPTGHFHVRYTHLGENVAENTNAVGFVRDDDRRELDSAISKTLFFRSGPTEQIEYDSNYNMFWSQAGLLRTWEIVQSLGIELRNRVSLTLRHTEDMQRFEKDFRNRATQVAVGYNTREFESASASLRFGRSFDSAFRVWTVGAARKLGARLSVEYELERLTLDPDPDSESTWIQWCVSTTSSHQTCTCGGSSKRIVPWTGRPFRLPSCGDTYRRSARSSSPSKGAPSIGQSEAGNALFLKATMVF